MTSAEDENSFEKELKNMLDNIETMELQVKAPNPTVLSNIFNLCTFANVAIYISDHVNQVHSNGT